MRFVSIPLLQNDRKFFLEQLTGNLLVKNTKQDQEELCEIHEEKVRKALDYCRMPYALTKCSKAFSNTTTTPYIRLYSRCLIQACKSSFWLARASTRLAKPVFQSTQEAMDEFRRLYPGDVQRDMCLPRALFAASTSLTFREKGVIFIGVFLPSRNMHAWIIENGMQPDFNDSTWINYQPMAALYY